MREMLKKIRFLENEMQMAESMSDYWTEEAHFDEGKSEHYEAEADKIYEQLYKVFEQAADRIVCLTSGQIDKAMARAMLQCKRSEVEKIFA